ncbi:5'-3' exonuclease (plasmid) [Burkholderia sp. KK1]|uniref:5'-3' exonuclease n=1 Tax=Burkholderia sp. M701 TaxID=326454 RepID=V5YN94_9BURK|nr:5'-3' exonuclease [Burkholderia sp. M701]AQH05517.1 5'-3' exonuclease [Burkholderia sp. KK1]BAO18788.1 putative 5'-3' exonuclease [Burkholderia sp. M701]
MAEFMLIDVNSIGYANQHSHTRTGQGMQVQAILGIIRSIAKRMREYPHHFPVVMWDGRAQWRYLAGATYEKQQPFIKLLAGTLGLTQAVAPSAEADDLGFQLMAALVARGHKVLQVTADTDSLQGYREGFSWLDPRFGRIIRSPAEQALVGTDCPRTYLEAKALEGDTSDTIGGVSRVGIPTALKIFATYGGSMSSFYEAVGKGQVDLKKKILGSLASDEGRAIFARNMKLMDLAAAPALQADDIVITTEPVNQDGFQQWIEHFDFSDVIYSAKGFLAPFRALGEREEYGDLMNVVECLQDIEYV